MMATDMGTLTGMLQRRCFLLVTFLACGSALKGNEKIDSTFLRSVVDSSFTNKPNADSWSYTCTEDSNGPSHWAELSPDFSLCSRGHTQSPVTIETFNLKVDRSLPPLDLTYDNSPDYVNATVLNDGHNVKMIREGGSLIFGGVNYSLTEFHMHTPSEHTVDGISYPMEMHLTHVSETGAIAIVGAFFQLSGKDNYKLNQYFPLFPHLKVGQPVHDIPSIIISTPKDMFEYYVYEGSLTEPPCTERVLYTIIKQVYSLSTRQLKWLQGAVNGRNNRPIQDLNKRTIYTTKYFKRSA
nr:carbonic anhydrase-like 3 [Phlegmariurus tetrastichus]